MEKTKSNTIKTIQMTTEKKSPGLLPREEKTKAFEVKQVPGTPFTYLDDPDKETVEIGMGRYKITDYPIKKEDLEKYFTKNAWDITLKMIFATIDFIEKNPKTNKTKENGND